MKKIIYLSCTCDSTYRKKYIGKNPKVFAYQADKYHKLLIDGLVNNKDIDVKAISMLPVNNKNCKKIYLKKHVVKNKNLELNHLSIINIPIIKNIFMILNSFFNIVFEKKDNKTIMIGDVLNISLIIGALIACKIKKIKTVGIVTDIPQFLSTKKII